MEFDLVVLVDGLHAENALVIKGESSRRYELRHNGPGRNLCLGAYPGRDFSVRIVDLDLDAKGSRVDVGARGNVTDLAVALFAGREFDRCGPPHFDIGDIVLRNSDADHERVVVDDRCHLAVDFNVGAQFDVARQHDALKRCTDLSVLHRNTGFFHFRFGRLKCGIGFIGPPLGLVTFFAERLGCLIGVFLFADTCLGTFKQRFAILELELRNNVASDHFRTLIFENLFDLSGRFRTHRHRTVRFGMTLRNDVTLNRLGFRLAHGNLHRLGGFFSGTDSRNGRCDRRLHQIAAEHPGGDAQGHSRSNDV